MIVVTADIWPHGAPPDSEYGQDVAARQSLHVGSLIIGNNGKGNSDLGFYDLFRGDPLKRAEWKLVGHIDAFPRGRHQSHAPALVARAIELVGLR